MEKVKMPNFIEELSNYLYAIKNYSKLYINNLTITIKQFLDFINIHKFKNKYDSIEDFTLNDIRTISNSDIYSFIYFLVENHYKQNTRITKVEHIRTFFDFLFRIKHNVFTEPLKKVKHENKTEQKLPKYFSLEESKKILKLYQNGKKVNEIRDHAILHIFLNCGLRLSEIVNLNIDDVNLNEDKIIILGKGNKERIGYLNKSTKIALMKYLDIRNNMLIDPQNDPKALFISSYKTRISASGIKRLVKKAYYFAKVDSQNHSTHSMRHTCATLMYRSGIDIKIIKEVLGHVQIDTTEIYTHLHDQELKDAMLQHPLSQYKMSDALAYCT